MYVQYTCGNVDLQSWAGVLWLHLTVINYMWIIVTRAHIHLLNKYTSTEHTCTICHVVMFPFLSF